MCIVELTDELEMCIPAVNDVADDVEAKLLGEAISRYLYTLSDEKQVMLKSVCFHDEGRRFCSLRWWCQLTPPPHSFTNVTNFAFNVP